MKLDAQFTQGSGAKPLIRTHIGKHANWLTFFAQDASGNEAEITLFCADASEVGVVLKQILDATAEAMTKLAVAEATLRAEDAAMAPVNADEEEPF
jgi:hypothetical protein